MEKITEKLLKFEKYMRKASFHVYIKKKMIWYFHEIFIEELRETESGKKWESKLQMIVGKIKLQPSCIRDSTNSCFEETTSPLFCSSKLTRVRCFAVTLAWVILPTYLLL